MKLPDEVADWQEVAPNAYEAWKERAALMEVLGRLERDEAELIASIRVRREWRRRASDDAS